MQPRFFPDKVTWLKLAQEYDIVPLCTQISADCFTPVSLFNQLVGNDCGFLFESVEQPYKWGRFSFIGKNPVGRIIKKNENLSCDRLPFISNQSQGRLFDLLSELISNVKVPNFDGLPPLYSGLVGYIGYDLVRELEPVGEPQENIGDFPEAILEVIGQIVAFDHWLQKITVVQNAVIKDRDRAKDYYELAEKQLVDTVNKLSSEFRPGVSDYKKADTLNLVYKRHTERSDFVESVKKAKHYIKEGDIFQVVLSQIFEIELEVDPFECYRALRVINPSPYLYFMRFNEVTVIGSSPEPMVKLTGKKVISRPIAGTRPRGVDEVKDAEIAEELIKDPKERSEHVMLVDLARNDVGKLVKFGSEKVDEFMVVEKYSHVIHLTSQVSGELKDDLNSIDVLKACLPAGTLSGAPKVRAMQIINELERYKRSLYGGVVGYIDFSGNLDTAIAIRTMVVLNDKKAFVQAGAGIVADSIEENEDNECLAKASALFWAIQTAAESARHV
jgi:anthranilate synthase component 1